MAAQINAGIPSSKWVNPPTLSPYKTRIPSVLYCILSRFIYILFNHPPLSHYFHIVILYISPLNQGLKQ